MEPAKITFIIDGNTYSLRATDTVAIREIPSANRQQLISLLEAVKQQESIARASVEQAAERARPLTQAAGRPAAGSDPLAPEAVRPERLGSGDVDALMARLVMEDERDRKPGLTKQGIFKWAGGFTALVVLLILLL